MSLAEPVNLKTVEKGFENEYWFSKPFVVF